MLNILFYFTELLLGQLLVIVKKPDTPIEVIHLAFQFLYFITKVPFS